MDGSRAVKVIAFGTASAVHIVGYATPSWAIVRMNGETDPEAYEYHYGLWQHCDHRDPTLRQCFLHGINDQVWLKSVQALETVGLLGLVLSIAVFAILWCSKKSVTMNHRGLKIANVVIICATGILIIVGVSIFGVSDFAESFNKLEGDAVGRFGYSFYLSTGAGGFMLLVNVPIMIYDICREEKPERLIEKEDIVDTEKSGTLCICQRQSSLDLADHDDGIIVTAL